MKNKIQSFFTVVILLFPLLTFAALNTPTEDFIDNNDGTVTHKKTGLTWQRCAVGQTWTGSSCNGSATHSSIKSAAQITNNFAGKSDWRIPRIDELTTIIEDSKDSSSINSVIFPNGQFGFFLSSTPVSNNPTKFWLVEFSAGYAVRSDRDSQMESIVNADGVTVRLVRGGTALPSTGEYTPTSDFIDNGDGTVTHKKTNLTWQRCPAGQTWISSNCSGQMQFFPYLQAINQTSNVAGKNDWRLPTITELRTIVEYKNISPALNTTIFPNSNSGFLSHTEYDHAGVGAWVMFFNDGYGGSGNLTDRVSGAIQFVRGSWSSSTTDSTTATKPSSPVLLAPTDISKGVSKDSIKFTWQAPQNETNAKVNSYRIVISENIRFNGYSPNTGKCNVTCVVGVVNTPSYSTSLRSSNKTYYWHVQAISSNENGEWSTTNYFKTDIGVPTVTAASASPSSTTLGSNVKFSATLSSNLPSNYTVKLSYGTSIVDMTGSGTSYGISQTPSQLGQQVFTIGIYDGSNALKGTAFKGNFEIVKGNSAPTLSLIAADASTTIGTNYSIQLQASDVDNNLKSISVIWGDGASDTQTGSNATILTFTHSYSTANTYTWSATATDNSNTTSIAVSKSISVTAPSVTPPSSGTSKLNDTGITTCSNATTNNLPCPVSDFPNQDAQSGRDATNNDDTDGHAGFSFTKINSTGASLPASATSWNCVKDNVTGLMWEVKTTDGGLHDQNHTYTWYEPDNTKNGGDAGTQNGGVCSGSQCDTNAYVKAVNSAGYCGYKDWRMPTRQELTSIVDFSRTAPTIDINYFQSTQSNWYWSSSPYAYGSSYAWYVFFNGGGSYDYVKYGDKFVRLVR